MANALIFEADAAAVAVLAADKAAGELRHDRSYDLVSSVMDSRPADAAAPAPAGESPCWRTSGASTTSTPTTSGPWATTATASWSATSTRASG
ncbi:MAG: hypothetical protein IPH09_15400 [bacterium]|nr:hypothetical protein [bacterium]